LRRLVRRVAGLAAREVRPLGWFFAMVTYLTRAREIYKSLARVKASQPHHVLARRAW
jgi:hypothetical protein